MRSFYKYCQLGVLLLITSSFSMTDAVAQEAVTPKQADGMQSENKAIIVDVREDDEWNEHQPNLAPIKTAL
ncbi:MAG: hypothetical protein NTX38_07045 [Methylobacter sp.]|nr:hypothetical protein [Methylobacter sp.]